MIAAEIDAAQLDDRQPPTYRAVLHPALFQSKHTMDDAVQVQPERSR